MDFFLLSYTKYNYGGIKYLSIVDMAVSILWVLIVLAILYAYKQKRSEPEYKRFIPFFLFKMFAVYFFAVMNSYLYGGADSAAFWHMSNAITDLMFKNFPDFMHEMFVGQNGSFYKNGIHHPGWIYKESEGFFMAKITWIFSFISGKQYLLASLYFSFLTFLAQWRLYRLLMKYFIKNKDSKFHILFLYMPSVAFWCSGIAKDTVVFLAILNIVYFLTRWFFLKERKLKYALGFLFYAWLILHTREIILGIVIVSFVLTWIFTLVNSLSQPFIRGLLRFTISFIGLAVLAVGLYVFQLNQVLDGYLEEGQIIQQDFENNPLYTGKRYSLGMDAFTPLGMLLVSPMAIFAGIFRPGIWEALTSTLLLNGIESTILLYLFFKRVVFKAGSFSLNLFNHKILLLCGIITLLYAFSTGLTAVIFGVLVRLRAPLLLFFMVVIYWKDFVVAPEAEKDKTTY